MDKKVLTIDGQYSVCMPIKDQIPFGQPRHGFPVGPEEITTVLAVCCPDGLLTNATRTEDFPCQLATLQSVLTGGRHQTFS